MDTRELLQFMVQQNISDIHFKANCAPLIRLNGQLLSTQKEPFSPEIIHHIAFSMMNDAHKKRFEAEGEIDFSYSLDNVSRFRVNVYRQKGTLAMSLRVIPLQLKPFEELNLPSATLQKLCAVPSGLILLAGVTGAGKTTTLNAMVNHLNQAYAYNIITIEDPIEFYHKDHRSSISQREVGNDTVSFATALKYILRQDPDVIVIGEMRDTETILAAITAAETGHIVLSTIHTMDAIQTVQRIVDSYPVSQQSQVRAAVANVLRGVIAQKLLTTAEGNGRIPCTDILITTPYVRQLITDGKTNDLHSVMSRGQGEGMMTFDQDLLRLLKEGKILRESALRESTRPDNFLSMLQGISVKL
ncbi:MAG: PilT/PilU family type 4a pilus ATPase [Elusimicrobiota bacterium]|jgi:twitching motility protein PilT